MDTSQKSPVSQADISLNLEYELSPHILPYCGLVVTSQLNGGRNYRTWFKLLSNPVSDTLFNGQGPKNVFLIKKNKWSKTGFPGIIHTILGPSLKNLEANSKIQGHMPQLCPWESLTL